MVEGYDTRIFGLNLRLPELSAAIAKVQMKKLTKMLELRRQNAELLTKSLLPIADRTQLKLPQEYEEKKFNWYLYTVAFEKNNRDKIKDKMIQDKIGATVYYNPPVHKTPYYEKMILSEANLLINTNWASEHVLSLPVHPLITKSDIERIENSLEKNIL
jgi:perosamine synthetase